MCYNLRCQLYKIDICCFYFIVIFTKYVILCVGDFMFDICPGYCGVTCVDGSCPVANIDEYIERDYFVIHNCDECPYYKGCDDCCFSDTEYCALTK